MSFTYTKELGYKERSNEYSTVSYNLTHLTERPCSRQMLEKTYRPKKTSTNARKPFTRNLEYVSKTQSRNPTHGPAHSPIGGQRRALRSARIVSPRRGSKTYSVGGYFGGQGTSQVGKQDRQLGIFSGLAGYNPNIPQYTIAVSI